MSIAEATALLDEATKECGTARQTADGQANYLTAKTRAQQACSELDKLPENQKKPFAKELEEIKKKIGEATTKAEKDKKPAEAMPLLAEAEKLLKSTKTKAEMQAGLNEPVPNVEYIKQLMNEAGGTKAMDEMVLAMDETANRNVLEAALEARFNLNFKQSLTRPDINQPAIGTADKTAPDKSVKRIYELLMKVPESHVAKNRKITDRAFERNQEDVGGGVYYYGGDTSIALTCGRAGSKGSSNQGAELGSPSAFPDGVIDSCQPNAEAKNKDIRYFDWATLHEVGHAVDDKNGIMRKKQSDPGFGGWEVYPDVTKTAEAAQKEFKYDLNYIKEKLKGNNPGPVATPGGKNATEWSNAQAAVDKFCTKVLSYGIWWDGTGSKEVQLGDRIYQHMGNRNELPPRLVSYLASERSKGIHGYQFRAPAEWFAELYAAYYMEVLKPEHPSIKAIKAYLPDALG